MNLNARHLVFLLSLLIAFPLKGGSLQWEAGKGYRRAEVRVEATAGTSSRGGDVPYPIPQAHRVVVHRSSAPGDEDVPAPGKTGTGFTRMPPEKTGILWTNIITEQQVARNYNMVSGAGVAAGDFDGDGLCDLYFCNRNGENALFRNLGDWKFENVTATAGVACANQSATAATFADMNGDGRLDLLVTLFWGPNACFLNLGNGRFTNVTQSAGLLARGGANSMALGDVDGDGDLDLYMAYFGVEAILREGGRLSFQMVNGQPVVTGRHARRLRIVDGQLVELGEQDVLYLNDGTGRFSPADWAQHFRDEDGQPVGSAPMDFGLSVQIRDIDQDGHPDIYCCNDFQTPDRLWLNDGKGRFRAIPRLALRNMSYASMGVDFADIDRDGRLDFLTVDMFSRDHPSRLRQASSMPTMKRQIGAIDDREAVPRNALYWNRGDGTYAEIAWFSGLEASDWSWAPAFLDVDLDGFEDLLVSTGTLHDVMDWDAAAAAAKVSDPRKQLALYPPLNNRNAAFRNRGDLTFEDVSQSWGFDARDLCQGMALADLDNDGDLDVVMNCANTAPLLCRNDSTAPRVAVRLKGLAPNTEGIGAKVRLLGGAVPVQEQEVICGGRYLSGGQAMRVFAAGTSTHRLKLEVTWRNGKRSVVNEVRANHVYEIEEAMALQGGEPIAEMAGDDVSPLPPRGGDVSSPPRFEDVSQLLNHVHHEEEFDDFERQPLLPGKLSQGGPGVAWHDLDGDGWTDLVIGSGKGGQMAVFRNNGDGGFDRWAEQGWEQGVSRDQGGIVGFGRSVLVGSSNYEDGVTTGPGGQVFRVGAKGEGPAFAGSGSSTGPLALTDMDGDGELELFVGGRVVPGRYPEPAVSQVFSRRQGRWELEAENTRVVRGAGLVSGAVWSDLTGDGLPELILACEWGPVRIYRNQRGRLGEWNPPLRGAGSGTLNPLTGRWNGVTTGDFDGDGRMDIVAGNWGLNSEYRPSAKQRIYYGDVDGRGRVDLVEGYYNEAMNAEVPARDLKAVSAAIPSVRAKFSSFAAYARASLKEIYGEKLAALKVVEATTFQSMVFLNRGDHFEAVPLPGEAQFSPVFALCTGDMDGDGDEDIFLGQNFFAVQPEGSRLNAGRGLWLAGDGRGRFQVVPGGQSGVRIYGEQRGAALGDYDRDGRIDLVVTQNGAATKLYRNVGARPGLRVRLAGPPGNPSGAGAQMRLEHGGVTGPMREVHAGSGYWSQDDHVQVLAFGRRVDEVGRRVDEVGRRVLTPPQDNSDGRFQDDRRRGGDTAALPVQDGAVRDDGRRGGDTAALPTRLWVRWPGGKITTVSVPPGAREIEITVSGEMRITRKTP